MKTCIRSDTVEACVFTVHQTETFMAWTAGLRDVRGRARITSRLDALRHGQFGDVVLEVKPLKRGEGFTFDCIDGCCEDAEMGCDLCTRPCSWCTPPSRNDAALRKILGDAINDLPPPPGDGGR